ncbi:UDP-N-acetylmuramate dehydrogenase [bacterium]|nr:UDP-N-acetylmuramate dehydrogenase [bacterium]
MIFFSAKDETEAILKQKLGPIERGFPLKKLSFVRLGGRARYLFKAFNKKQLIKAVKIARSLNLPHVVVGSASNILFLDEGFSGLVIVNRYNRLSSEEAVRVSENEVLAPSGITLLSLVKELAQRNKGGLEFLATIPGTLAGAVVNNAGAFSKEIKDVLLGINVLDKKGNESYWSQEKLALNYRSSALKGAGKRSGFLSYPVVLNVRLKIEPKQMVEVKRMIQSHFLIRQKSQPRLPSLGCVFKNPLAPAGFKGPKREGRISAGFLLDSAGLKGQRLGRIQISEIHANFFVNLGGGKSKDYLLLAERAKEAVRKKFAIMLEEEIEVAELKEEK